jgi:hypothetical protein
MEDFTPGTLKAFQVALVEPVAYLEDSVIHDFGGLRRGGKKQRGMIC